MRIVGLLIVELGIIYLVYSILFKNQITLYNKDDKMTVINIHSYLRLQLYFGIIGSVYFVVIGLITAITNINICYTVLSVLLFHFINRSFKIISKKEAI